MKPAKKLAHYWYACPLCPYGAVLSGTAQPCMSCGAVPSDRKEAR